MKKIIALVMVMVLCLSLAACGTKEEKGGTKIAVQKGTTALMYAQVLKGAEAVSYDTFALAANDMKNGNAAYVFVDKTTANALCKEISGIKILADKAAEIDAIKDKYMNGEEASYVGVTSAAKDVNRAAEQLVVATNAEFAPWEYKEGNQFFGIDMEIAKLIADELGLELVIDDMEFDAVVGAVGKQNVDIAMSGITITTERLGVINFSEPYYTESIVCVVKESNTELDSAGTVVDMLNVICAEK